MPSAPRLHGATGQGSGDDAYLPLKHLALHAGIGVRTLRGYLSHPSRPLPHYRVGGKVLVRRSEFDEWMSGFRVTTLSRVGAIVADVLGKL